MRAEIERIAAGRGGGRLELRHALYLLGCDDLLWLAALADGVRRRLHPQPVVTYLIDRNINYTNVCMSGCRFCAFYRRESDPGAYLLGPEEIGVKIDQAKSLGATSILLQGGLHPGLGIEYFEDLFRYIKNRHPIHLHALSPPEIVHIARRSGLSIAEAIGRLREAGLGSIPGGGAEILSDRPRRELSPHKCSVDEWIEVMREAHRQGLRSSATMMFGSIETPEEIAEHLLRVRALQAETGGFTAFIPWTFQPSNTALAEVGLSAADTGAVPYLRTLATARLVLDNIPNIQTSWVTQGAKTAQTALAFGANDFGSTMIEENVVAAAGVTYRISEAEIVRHIAGTGYKARRRDVHYNDLGDPLHGPTASP
jgi:cyclic dehypoxanthinyl futalosine synthase